MTFAAQLFLQQTEQSSVLCTCRFCSFRVFLLLCTILPEMDMRPNSRCYYCILFCPTQSVKYQDQREIWFVSGASLQDNKTDTHWIPAFNTYIKQMVKQSFPLLVSGESILMNTYSNCKLFYSISSTIPKPIYWFLK